MVLILVRKRHLLLVVVRMILRALGITVFSIMIMTATARRHNNSVCLVKIHFMVVVAPLKVKSYLIYADGLNGPYQSGDIRCEIFFIIVLFLRAI